MGTATAQLDTSTAPPNGLEYKAAGTAGVLLNSDDEQGIVELLASVTGIVDDQGDRVIPGAYAKTLAKRKMKGVRHHDWARMAAKTLVQEEWLPGDSRLPATLPNGDPWPKEAGALYVKGQYNLETKDGKEGYSNAKFYADEGQWSIGYKPAPGGAKRDTKGIRDLSEVDLYEWSDVLHGAAPQTSTLAVKAADSEPGGDADTEHDAGDGTKGMNAGMETKVRDCLPGSYEERRDVLREAVRRALAGPTDGDGRPEWYVYSVGTFSDRVVVNRVPRGDGETQTWQIPYTITDDGTVQLGEMLRVQLVAQVVPAGKSGEPSDATVEAVVHLLTDAAALLTMAATADTAGVKGVQLQGDDATRLADLTVDLLDALAVAGVEVPDGYGDGKSAEGEEGEEGDEDGTEADGGGEDQGDEDGAEGDAGGDGEGTESKGLELDLTEVKAQMAALTAGMD